MGVAVGDYDNDGYEDLYVTAYGGNKLYHNNGDGTFTDVTQKASVGGVAGRRVPHGLIWMAMDSLIWSCCATSNGILTTSGAENTKKDTEPIAIPISSNRFLRSYITTTEMNL